VSHAFRANAPKFAHVTCFDAFHVWAPLESGACPVISARTTRGDEVLSLDPFDLFVVSAGGWWAGRNKVLSSDAPSHPLAHAARAEWLPLSSAVPASLKSVSEAAFDETVYSWVSGHGMTELVRFIGANHGRRVLWQPWPAPSRAMKHAPDWALTLWYGENGPSAWLGFFRSQYKALQRLSAEIGDKVRLLPYPSTDILEDGFMDESLCEADPFHGNIRYGSLVATQLEPLLAR
jgi:hypothetical protein